MCDYEFGLSSKILLLDLTRFLCVDRDTITLQLLNHLNYSGLPLWRRVNHLVRLKTDSAVFTAYALADEASKSYYFRCLKVLLVANR